jgi:Plasmid pRiA4b ORF-3-like protein
VTYRIRIDLNGPKPSIWRRLEVASDLTLDRLHDVLQAVMGWNDSHLHEFISGKNATERLADHYRPQSSIDEGLPGVEESSIRLDEVVVEPGDRLFYNYDFGDDWTHTLRLEAVEPRGAGQPWAVCVAGARACPPEDSGGVWGYLDLLAALNAPGESGDRELLRWVGPDFDPEHFEVDEVNASLGYLDTVNRVLESLASLVDPTSRVGELVSRLDQLPDDLARAIVAALEPAPEPDSETKAAMLRSYQLLLNQVGDAGIALTQAGYLPPALVKAVADILQLDNSWIGKFNRESQTIPVLDFRESAQRLGLLRKAHNKLTLTKAGAKARNDVNALWKSVTAALPLGLTSRGAEVQASQDAGLLLLIAVGAGLPKSERGALVSGALAALGWRTEPFKPLGARDVRQLVDPTESVLEHVGAIPRWTFRDVTPAEAPPPEAVKAFAQVALRR